MCLLDLEFEWGKAGTLEEVGAITEGLVREREREVRMGGELSIIISPSLAMWGSQKGCHEENNVSVQCCKHFSLPGQIAKGAGPQVETMVLPPGRKRLAFPLVWVLHL